MTTAAEQIVFPLRRLEGARLSELARCPRMAAYGAQRADRKDWSELERRYLTRGRMYGRFVAEQLALRYGADAIEVEREIAWPHGTGHADVYVKPEKLIVEVVSTVAPSTQVLGFKLWQARLYLHFDPDAEQAQVYAINPSSLVREDVYPVELNDDHRAQIEQWVAGIGEALRDPERLPERVCAKPSDGRSHLCPFVDTCFADWTPPTLTAIDDEEVIELAARHHQLAEQERISRKATDSLNGERKKLEARLAEKVDPGEYDAGGYQLRRTPVARESLQLGKARAAGAWTPLHDAVFGPFVTVSEHDRWSVKRPEGDAVSPGTMADYEHDYGDVPF